MKVILTFLLIYTSSAFSNNNVQSFILEFIDLCAKNPTGGIDLNKYLTDDYILLGGELDNTTFYIIDDYSIKKIERRGNEVYVKIALECLGSFCEDRFFMGNETIFLEFLLIHNNENKWRIKKQLNDKELFFLEDVEIGYINSLLNELNPNLYTKNNINRVILEKIYPRLFEYFRTEYTFPTVYLERMNIKELRILRNEIFARYGRQFKTEWLQNYFNEQGWYKPNPNYSDSLLTENDIKNIKIIRSIEQKKEAKVQN